MRARRSRRRCQWPRWGRWSARGTRRALPAESGTKGKRAIKPLLEALSDPDPAQRRIAVTLLGHLADANAVLPLLVAAPRWSTRLRAVRALARIGGPRAEQTLALVLRSDRVAYVREAAAEGLGRLASGVAALHHSANVDHEPRVRGAAVRALRALPPAPSQAGASPAKGAP